MHYYKYEEFRNVMRVFEKGDIKFWKDIGKGEAREQQEGEREEEEERDEHGYGRLGKTNG
jgi:hypothetical protein